MKRMKTYEGLRVIPKQDQLMSELRTAINLTVDIDVASIIVKGLNINVRENNNRGDTPLIQAIKTSADGKFGKYSAKFKMVKDLIENGADVNLSNCPQGIDFYQSPLIIACLWGASTEIIKLLLDNGADMNFKWENYDFYDCAVRNGHDHIVKWIEENYPKFMITKRFDL